MEGGHRGGGSGAEGSVCERLPHTTTYYFRAAKHVVHMLCSLQGGGFRVAFGTLVCYVCVYSPLKELLAVEQ